MTSSLTISAADEAALDYPIRSALTGLQRPLAIGDDLALRYLPEIGPLSALIETTPQAFEALAALIPPQGGAALFTPEAVMVPVSSLVIDRTGNMVQMVATELPTPPGDVEIVPLGAADVPEMLRLIELTKPGPFAPRTYELGNYVGIRQNGELAAMAGERLHLTGYTEVSAVCVHPDYRGRGYARTLILNVMQGIARRNETPFLHTRADNTPAIALYRQLGFVLRKHLHLTVLVHTPVQGIE